MKNIIIVILVVIILVLGFLFLTQNKSSVNYEPLPGTESATVKPITNNSVQNNTIATTNTNNNFAGNNQTTPSQNSNIKTYSGNGFKIDYPKDIVVTEENAEDGTVRLIYFGQDLVVRYSNNPAWVEQYDLAELELVGSKTVNGNTFKIYQDQTGNTLWLKSENEGWMLNFRDGSRMSLDTFDLL